MRRGPSAAFLALTLAFSLSSDGQTKKLTMSGVVTDKQSHTPIEGAIVTVVGNKANEESTDADGSFILSFAEGIQEGEPVRIHVEKSGYRPYDKLVAVSSKITLQVPLPAQSQPAIKKPSGPSRDIGQNGDASSAIGKLAALGWQVQPVEGTSLQFSDIYKHISMRQSAGYFRALDRPFMVNIVGAKSLEGVGGLRNAKHLTKLELSASEIDDLSELRHLHNLQALVMGQTAGHISDLTPLHDLKQLKQLGLDSATIRDLTPIQELTNITMLSIGGTQVSDLSPIHAFRHLQTLNLGGAPVTDLSPLAGIDTLTEMQLNGEEIVSLSTFPRNNNLTTLSVYSPSTVDLSPIGRLSGLESLNLYIFGPQGFDVSVVRQLKRLTKLSMMGNGIEYISPIKGLDAIDELPRLRTLGIFGVQMTDLAFVADLQSLTEISVTNAPLSNISALSQIKSLKSVTLAGTSVVDISPLLNLSKLENLSIMRTPARSDVVTALERRGVKIQR